ncbi:MAG: pur operon repressor [Clostridia bacterium]|nr:pur operon repressor [Clostridia bacterium]
MEKVRRNERLSAMLKTLSDTPNHIFTLSTFCEMFGSAKSTTSEDIDILRDVVTSFDLGEIATVTGAAGGVMYRATVRKSQARQYIEGLCKQLSGTDRVLPGGFLYYSDILSDPLITRKMGAILATEYFDDEPDFVLTMETKGIPVALTTAHALGVPLVIARHSSKVYEGSAVNINYVSGSSGNIQTMSLARRAISKGQRCLIVDDFLKGGGTAKGMIDLMREFNVEVIGMAFVMSTKTPVRKRISGEKSLMTLEIASHGDDQEIAKVTPAPWLLT